MDSEERVWVKTSDGLDRSVPEVLIQASPYLQHLPACCDTTVLHLPFPSSALHFLTAALVTECRDVGETAGQDPQLYAEVCALADYLGCEEVLEGLMQALAVWAHRAVQVSEEREVVLRAVYPWAASYMRN